MRTILTNVNHAANAAAVLGVALALFLTGPWLLDMRHRVRAAWTQAQSAPALQVVALGDDYGHREGFPKRPSLTAVGRLVEAVAPYEPRVVVADVRFAEADTSRPGYRGLCQAVRSLSSRTALVVPAPLLEGTGNTQVLDALPECIRTRALVGYPRLWEEVTQFHASVREMRLAVADDRLDPAGASPILPSLALASLAAWQDVSPVSPDSVLGRAAGPDPRQRLSDHPQGTPPHEDTPYAGRPRYGALSLSSAEVLRAARAAGLTARSRGALTQLLQEPRPIAYDPNAAVPHTLAELSGLPAALRERILQGRLVLLGATYRHPTGEDTFGTPFGERRGVWVHAQILNTLLTGQTPWRLGPWVGIVVSFLLAAVIALIVGHRQAGLKGLLAAVILLAGYEVLAAFVFSAAGILMPAGAPLATGFLALTLYRTRLRLRGRALVRRARRWLPQGNPVSPDVPFQGSSVKDHSAEDGRARSSSAESAPTDSARTRSGGGQVPAGDDAGREPAALCPYQEEADGKRAAEKDPTEEDVTEGEIPDGEPASQTAGPPETLPDSPAPSQKGSPREDDSAAPSDEGR